MKGFCTSFSLRGVLSLCIVIIDTMYADEKRFRDWCHSDGVGTGRSNLSSKNGSSVFSKQWLSQ